MLAAIDVQLGAGDVGRLPRTQEVDHVGDFRGLAEAAQRDGVDVTLEVFPEMQHVFQIGAGNVPESDDAIAKIGAFLRPRLGL